MHTASLDEEAVMLVTILQAFHLKENHENHQERRQNSPLDIRNSDIYLNTRWATFCSALAGE